jgi:hypothetical protein
MPESDRNFTDSLIALKTQYERSLTEATTKASHLQEQLSHVNALLLNQLLQGNGVVPQLAQSAAKVPVVEAIALAPAQSLAAPATEAPASVRPKPKASDSKTKAEPASTGYTPRELLPAYQGLKRLEAIAQVLEASAGEEVSIDALIDALFGGLSATEQKTERKRLITLLYNGEKRGLWQKGSATLSYVISASTGKAKAPATAKSTAQPKAKAKPTTALTKSRRSLEVLPAFEGLSKLDAIAAVLEQVPGEVLHQDTIIQTLYGDLSPEDLKKERVRIDASLRNGVKANKWKKAPVPASYVLEAEAGAKPKRPGRKPDPKPKPQPEPVAQVEASSAKASAAKAKPGRKPALAKAKTSQKAARSKKTELELVALLRKADIQV